MGRLIALLDRPSKESLGIVPLVLETTTGLILCGFKGGPRPLAAEKLREGEHLGSVLRVEGPEVSLGPEAQLAAGWLGHEFARKAQELGAPEIRTDELSLNTAEDGQYWFDRPERVVEFIDSWVIEAARIAIDTRSPDLAELMEQASPDHFDTCAALYATRTDEVQRREELEWIARLERDAGRPVEIDELERRLEERVAEIRCVSPTEPRLGDARDRPRQKSDGEPPRPSRPRLKSFDKMRERQRRGHESGLGELGEAA